MHLSQRVDTRDRPPICQLWASYLVFAMVFFSISVAAADLGRKIKNCCGVPDTVAQILQWKNPSATATEQLVIQVLQGLSYGGCDNNVCKTWKFRVQLNGNGTPNDDVHFACKCSTTDCCDASLIRFRVDQANHVLLPEGCTKPSEDPVCHPV